jgi:NAD(P)-dependent dehydrogenase (short-subunit alcohol dehydrogenase family)
LKSKLWNSLGKIMTMREELPKGRGRLSGKVALVVGGGSIGPGWGNGKAAAVLYAIEGAKLLVVDLRQEAADETVEMIRAAGGAAIATAADASDEQAVRGFVKACLERYGRIDVLHNNVGGQGTGRSLKNITVADWNATLARNLTSAMLACRAVVPIMEAQGGGSIINISSISSLRHLNVPTAVYAAAKGGLNEFSKNIALQHASTGVRVNCVLPGYIDTPFIRRNIGGRPNYEIKGFNTAEEYSAARNQVIPMRRMGTAWDVAYACLFLASDESSYITATTIVVDGGVTATCPGT